MFSGKLPGYHRPAGPGLPWADATTTQEEKR